MANVTTLLKYSLKTNIVKAILFDVITNISRYYYTFGKTDKWPFLTSTENGNSIVVSSETVPPSVIDSYDYELEVRKNSALAKLIDINDVAIVVNRRQWTQGFIYDMYDEYSSTNPSFTGATSIDQASFYVINSRYQVFKCLFNNGNRISSIEPVMSEVNVSAPIATSDGYIWKYMYTIPLSLRNKFLSDEYMPVTTALTNSFYSNGAISGFTITNPGKNIPQFRRIKALNITSGGTNYGSITFNFQNPSFVIGSAVKPTVTVTLNGSGTATAISFTQGLYYLTNPIPTVTTTNALVGNGTWTSSGNTVTITKASHGLISGQAYLDFTSVSGGGTQPTDGVYTIVVVDSNTFTTTFTGVSGNGNVTISKVASGFAYSIEYEEDPDSGYNTIEITGDGKSSYNGFSIKEVSISGGRGEFTAPSGSPFTFPNPPVLDFGGFAETPRKPELEVVYRPKHISAATWSFDAASSSKITVTKTKHGYSNGNVLPLYFDTVNTGTYKPGNTNYTLQGITNDTPNTFEIPITNALNGSAVIDLGAATWEIPKASIVSASWSASGTTVTITKTSHGLVQNSVVYLQFTSGASRPADGNYTITGVATDTFTVTVASGSGSGNCDYQSQAVPTVISITKSNHGIANGSLITLDYTGVGDTPTDVANETITVVNASNFTVPTKVNGNATIDGASATWSCTVTSGISTITLVRSSHGFTNGQTKSLVFTSGLIRPANQTYTITVVDSNTVTIQYALILASTLTGAMNLTIPGATWSSAANGSGSTVTITKNGHGLSSGLNVQLSFTSGIFRPTDSTYTIASSQTNTFTVSSTLPINRSGTLTVDIVEVDWSITAGGSAPTHIAVTKSSHGYSNGNKIYLSFDSVNIGTTKPQDGVYEISSVSTNSFNILNSGNINQTISGKAKINTRIATWSYVSGESVVTITKPNHGLSNSDTVTLLFDDEFDSYSSAVTGGYVISNVTTNTFTVSVLARTTTVLSGTVSVVSKGILYEIDRVNVLDSGYGYDKPIRLLSSSSTDVNYYNATTTLMNTSAIIITAPVIVLTESTQRNNGSVRPLVSVGNINGKARILESVIINDPGIGYTSAVATFKSYIKDGGQYFIASSVTPFTDFLGIQDPYVSPTIVLSVSQGNTDSNQADVEIQAKDGSIEVILVTNSGSGYSSSTHSLTVLGDGTGCTASLVITNGAITGVNVTNSGSGYTYATFIINGDTKPETVTSGGNTIPNPEKARFRSVISPKGGHGRDAIQELFARSIAFYTKLNGSETNQGLSTDNSYRQISILKNPLTNGTNEYYKKSTATGCILLNIDKVSLANQAAYENLSEDIKLTIVKNGQTYEFVFVAKYEGADSYQVLLNPIDRYTPSTLDVLTFINNGSQTMTILKVTPPTYDKLSGELLYIDNRLAFNPSSEQAVAITTLISF